MTIKDFLRQWQIETTIDRRVIIDGCTVYYYTIERFDRGRLRGGVSGRWWVAGDGPFRVQDVLCFFAYDLSLFWPGMSIGEFAKNEGMKIGDPCLAKEYQIVMHNLAALEEAFGPDFVDDLSEVR